jgi:flagellar basal-body rod protein FlgG
MTGGLRAAGGAMSNFAARHDVISNNLSNVSTAGYAREDTFVEQTATAARPFENPVVHTRTDFRAGPPVLTDNPLDLSLEGSGFLVVSTEEGDRLTRLGSLRVGADGVLETADGHPVLGENGLLYAGEGRVSVEQDGAVRVDGAYLDRLRIVTFASGDDVERRPGGLWTVRAGRQPDEGISRPFVRQGQIEGSAVEPVSELVGMIQALRAYEAAASALRATDATLQKAVNDIARI